MIKPALPMEGIRRVRSATVKSAATPEQGMLPAVASRLKAPIAAAYGLTPDDVRLMWETAPPRMPLSGPPAATAR